VLESILSKLSEPASAWCSCCSESGRQMEGRADSGAAEHFSSARSLSAPFARKLFRRGWRSLGHAGRIPNPTLLIFCMVFRVLDAFAALERGRRSKTGQRATKPDPWRFFSGHANKVMARNRAAASLERPPEPRAASSIDAGASAPRQRVYRPDDDIRLFGQPNIAPVRYPDSS